MNGIKSDKLASLRFQARWRDERAEHTERLFARKVNFWRDIFPQRLDSALKGLTPGDRAELRCEPGELVPAFAAEKLHTLPWKQFTRPTVDGRPLVPRFGRFYPRGLLGGLPGIHPSNILPFRLVGLEPDSLTADCNHALARHALDLEAHVLDLATKQSDTGGQCREWTAELLDGPGMNGRWHDQPTDFFSGEPFAREATEPDLEFYRKPRLVPHTDAKAREVISGIYARLLTPGMEVLDCMSSLHSHLPEKLELGRIEGLGMNREELAANDRLTGVTVHDLNQLPELPYPDDSFDAVVCSVSVEYLCRPFAVFRDVARVLRPGGVFACTFSNRWFPGKAVRIWTELHEFERVGLVLEYYLESGLFTQLETWSERGWPRPWDSSDRYFSRTACSDPVYAVWGRLAPTGTPLTRS